MSEWSELLEACEEVTSGREAIRLANLSITAAAAGHRRLLGHRMDERRLAETLSLIAVEPLAYEPMTVVSRRLVEAADKAAKHFGRLSSMDAWVQAFQSSDPARKSRGAYATPQTLARPMARELLRAGTPVRLIDPSSGAGGLLLAVLTELKRRAGSEAEVRSHLARLHGVELDPVARELSCLLLWLHAGVSGLSPQLIAERVVTANAITRDWWSTDPFDGLIMNPPWDSLRHGGDADLNEELERDATLRCLMDTRVGAEDLPPLYSAQGRGDRNLYKAFVEMAPHLLSERGRLVALIPGAWSSDLGTAALRRMYLEHLAVEQWTSFENLRGYFPIDGRYKFGVLIAERAVGGTRSFRTRGFAADAADLRRRHVSVTAADIDRLGGSASILPDLVSARERSLMLRYLSNGYPLFSGESSFGNVRYERELDMTEDRKRGAFVHMTESGAAPTGDGTWVDEAENRLVPLVEGRMVAAYDFHAKSWQSGSGRRAKWTWANGHRLAECQPQFLAPPRPPRSGRVAICDVTSATNTRTVLASWVPPTWPCGNTAAVLVFESERLALAGLAVLNSMVFDWLARRLIAGLHLNRFYLEALAWPQLDDEQLNEIAAAAADLTAMSPRYADLPPAALGISRAGLDYVEAHVRIERLVASGYRLSAPDLGTVYDATTSDRRGFWRHFASDPHSPVVARAVLKAARKAPLRTVARHVSA
jgi:N-6 DNA Methylase